jgi:hypothetical protein
MANIEGHAGRFPTNKLDFSGEEGTDEYLQMEEKESCHRVSTFVYIWFESIFLENGKLDRGTSGLRPQLPGGEDM